MPTLNQRMTSEERRAAIMGAGERLFAERGFRGTTTRALADAVGVSEPVLYEHFNSKRDLYAAIVGAKSREGLTIGTALLEPYAKARDDRGFFTCLGEFILDQYTGDPAYIRLLLFVALQDPDLAALFHEHQREGRECLSHYIRQRMEEGAFRPVDPPLAARAFMGMIFHHAQACLLFPDDFVKGSRKEVVAGMVDIFLRGILPAR